MRLTQNFKLLGVVFLAMLVGGVYLTYGIFTKKFTDYDEVTLQTSTIGLQLPARADVKIRGVIVGEVLEFDTVSSGAELTLGIFPSELDSIPANVTGSIVPKTLFGEKYVSLVVPEDHSPDPIQTGAVIERTAIATEVEAVLADLYPLLRTVQPAEINLTLNALATALEGRTRLLVLDNCEHVVDAVADLIEKILLRSTTVRILATSREGLRVGGEVVWPVPPLRLPDPPGVVGASLPLAQLAANPAP